MQSSFSHSPLPESVSVPVAGRTHLLKLGRRPGRDVVGLRPLCGPLGGGAPPAHGRSSSRAASSAWHWAWVQGHRNLVSKQLRTPNRQKEEASGCIPCLPLTAAQLFLTCPRCSDPGAIQSLVRSGPPSDQPSDQASLGTGLQPAGSLVPGSSRFLGWGLRGPGGMSCM